MYLRIGDVLFGVGFPKSTGLRLFQAPDLYKVIILE